MTAETVMATTSKTLSVGLSTPSGAGEALISLSSVVIFGRRQKRKKSGGCEICFSLDDGKVNAVFMRANSPIGVLPLTILGKSRTLG